MSKRPLRLDDYGISRELYNELRWFCRQYPDKVAELSAIRGGFNNFRKDGMPKGKTISNPTESRAIRATESRLYDEVEAIEQAAIEADASLYQHIICNVTRGVRYEDMAVPCGVRQFYQARRKFFWCLAVKLEKRVTGV